MKGRCDMENEIRIDEMEKKLSSLENKLKAALRQDDELEVPMPLLASTFKRHHPSFACPECRRVYFQDRIEILN